MEDLDALLADLQSTTQNISSFQHSQSQPYHTQPLQQTNYRDHQHNLNGNAYPADPTTNPPRFPNQTSAEPFYSYQQQQQQNTTYYELDSRSPSQNSLSYSTPNTSRHEDLRGTRQGQGQPQGQMQAGVVTLQRRSYHSSDDHSGSSTPPPLPPPPPGDVLDSLAYNDQPIYEPQSFHVRERAPATEESRANRMSALSNNLSELDQLLQDLNSAQFMAEVDRKSGSVNDVTSPTLNGNHVKQPPPVATKPTRPPVTDHNISLELSPAPRFPVEPNYQEVSSPSANHSHQSLPAPSSSSASSSSSSFQQPQNASTATKELEELMMNLSEFKFQNKQDGSESADTEPAYAKPIKRQIPAQSPTSPHAPSPTARQPDMQGGGQREDGNLHSLLGDLESNLRRQGGDAKQKGVCAACDKPIVGQVIAALGRTWHVEHFCCANCEEELGTRNFYERDSMAYCEKCYHHLFAPRCAYCNGAIIDKCITALEKMWHPEHFFCAQCGCLFGEEDFHEKNSKAYCKNCYFSMFAPKCGGCAQPIMENYISALHRQWHPECFVCFDCHKTFGSGSFFDYEGLPYCETHYHAKKGSLCASCEKPITGRCITAMFKKFHPEHFVCAFCLKQLNKGTFKEHNDKPYCHPCFVKLFG